MIVEEPYFMSNEEWYYYDEDLMELKLTEKATEKAKKSYEEFYKIIKESETEELK